MKETKMSYDSSAKQLNGDAWIFPNYSGFQYKQMNRSNVNSTHYVAASGIVIGSLMLVIMITAVIGNFLVLLAIAKTKALQRLNNYLILSLALSDFGVAVVGMPFFISDLFRGGWLLPNSICVLYQVLDISFDVLSVVNLTAISIERVFIIAQPLSYHRLVTHCRMITLIVVMWLVCFTYGSLQILWFKTEDYQQLLARLPLRCLFYPSLAFTITDFVFTFVFPLIIMATSYIIIFRIVNSHMSRIHGRPSMMSDTVTGDFSQGMPSNFFSEPPVAWDSHIKPTDRDSGFNTMANGQTQHIPETSEFQANVKPSCKAYHNVHDRKTSNEDTRPRAFTIATSYASPQPSIAESREKPQATTKFVNQATQGKPNDSDEEQVFPIIKLKVRSRTWPCIEFDPSKHKCLFCDNPSTVVSVNDETSCAHAMQPLQNETSNKRPLFLNRTKTFTSLSILKRSMPQAKNNEGTQRISVTFLIPNDKEDKNRISYSEDTENSGSSGVATSSERYTSESTTSDSATQQISNNRKRKTGRSVSQTETIRGSKVSRETADVQNMEISSSMEPDVAQRQRRRRSSIRRVLRENKAVKMTAAVIGAFVLCWMPYEITIITHRACLSCVSNVLLQSLSALVYFSSAINPFIYNFYSKEFRKAIKKSIMCETSSVQPSQE